MFFELITELLQEGYKVNFSAPGHSMFPTIMANETIMVEPIDPGTVRLRDIILYRTNGRLIAHRVIRIEKEKNGAVTEFPSANRLQFVVRGDASRSCDDPVKAGQILGKVVSIERNGCHIDPYGLSHKISCLARSWANRIKRLPQTMFS